MNVRPIEASVHDEGRRPRIDRADLGRRAGWLYLFLVLVGPLRLIYIPAKLFVDGDATATANNIASHELLFRLGMVGDVLCALLLIFLTLAFYRLFERVDRMLATMVVVLGGIMPALLYFVNVARDAGALLVVRGAPFLSVFDAAQRDAIAMLLLDVHAGQNTAAEMLWGIWLLPLAALVYRSKFSPRLLAVWLALNGVAYVIVSSTGLLFPDAQRRAFAMAQPALFGELALMLWLVIKGARPTAAAVDDTAPLTT